jgi:hypothetical protein
MKKDIAYIRNKIHHYLKDAKSVHCNASDQRASDKNIEENYGLTNKPQKSGSHSLPSLHFFQNQHRM